MEQSNSFSSQIGIFWCVRWKAELRILAASCLVADGEPYGEMITYGPGHYTTWNRWRKSRTAHLERVITNAFEYEEWPRGRISFDTNRKRPLLLCDAKILKGGPIGLVFSRFNLSFPNLTTGTDPHYKSTLNLENG